MERPRCTLQKRSLNVQSVSQTSSVKNLGHSVQDYTTWANKFERKPVPVRSLATAAAATALLTDREDDNTWAAERLDAWRCRNSGHENLVSLETVECVACLETLQWTFFPDQNITSSCNHTTPDQICKGCLAHHLRLQLESNGLNRLTCPLCNNVLSYNEIQRWASPDVFSRIDSLQVRQALSQDQNFLWCSNPSCNSGQIHSAGASSPIMTCFHCGARTCFTHQLPWHEGLTCLEFDHPEVAEARERTEASQIAAIDRKRKQWEEQVWQQIQSDEALARKLARQEEYDERQYQYNQEEASRKQKAAIQAIRAEEERQYRRKLEEQQKQRAEHTERVKRRQEEQLGAAEVCRSSKQCPGDNCAYRVFRDGGCKHMTCKLR